MTWLAGRATATVMVLNRPSVRGSRCRAAWPLEPVVLDVGGDANDSDPGCLRIAGILEAFADHVSSAGPERARENLVDDRDVTVAGCVLTLEKTAAGEPDAHGLEVARRRRPLQHHRIGFTRLERWPTFRREEVSPMAAERRTAGRPTASTPGSAAKRAVSRSQNAFTRFAPSASSSLPYTASGSATMKAGHNTIRRPGRPG